MYGVIEKECVGCADHHVKFSHQLRAERFPVSLQDGGQVVVFAPVCRDVPINYTGSLIPYFAGIGGTIFVRWIGMVPCEAGSMCTRSGTL